MSQALFLVDRASHAGSFRCVPYERCLYRVLSSPFSCGRGIGQCSPSLCTVRFSFFPSIRSALDSHASSFVPDPPFHFSFLYSFGDTTARTPTSSSRPDPLSSPYFPLRRSHRKRTMSPTLSPQHSPSVYPSPAASAIGVLLSPLHSPL